MARIIFGLLAKICSFDVKVHHEATVSFTMTSKRKPTPVSPIPAVVEVAENDVHISLLKRFGTATPMRSKSTSKIVSPLHVFQSDGRSFRAQASSDRSYGGDGDSITVAERLGIRRPAYYQEDDESSLDHRTNGESSHRIGISRPSYELPEGGAPISPLKLFLEQKAESPTPNLIEIDHSDDSADPFIIAWSSSHERSSQGSRQSVDDSSIKDDDSIERMIHEATAEGHYLVSSTPISTPKDDIKYNLMKRKGGLNKAMKRASERHVTHRPPRPSGDRSHQPDASFKIFLLLLNPQAKIFELIQVIYAPSVTTIGDLLSMIPGNATEPALGSLTYIGLCRPKDGIEITDMSLMASGSHCKMNCARIILGEILVAIPAGFSGEKCAKLAVPILKNQRIQTLLKRSDPLGVKRRHKKSSRRGSGNSSRRRSGSNSSSRVETVKEESEGENSPQVKEAMKHALEAAAVSNAGLPDFSRFNSMDEGHRDINRSNSVDDSIAHLENWRTTTDFSYVTDSASLNDSVASSVGSTSSSYKSGLSNTMTFQSASRRLPRMSKSNGRRKHRREQRKYYAGRVAAVLLVAMVALYSLDGNAPIGREDMDQVLGFIGLVEFLVSFAALIKLQKYSQRGEDSETKCPFVRASLAAIESFQEQFAPKK